LPIAIGTSISGWRQQRRVWVLDTVTARDAPAGLCTLRPAAVARNLAPAHPAHSAMRRSSPFRETVKLAGMRP